MSTDTMYAAVLKYCTPASVNYARSVPFVSDTWQQTASSFSAFQLYFNNSFHSSNESSNKKLSLLNTLLQPRQ
ncbi:hypothetical protein Sjap_016762 [Stephania japonica]|uniref:Uncharacterized protein n=1 Tax=Stephania japonica TaxID=461633 RepID=A0AAP0I4W0_9MAGN